MIKIIKSKTIISLTLKNYNACRKMLTSPIGWANSHNSGTFFIRAVLQINLIIETKFTINFQIVAKLLLFRNSNFFKLSLYPIANQKV